MRRILLILVAAAILAGCEGEYLCEDYAIVIEDDGSMHVYGSGCEYDYTVPLPAGSIL